MAIVEQRANRVVALIGRDLGLSVEELAGAFEVPGALVEQWLKDEAAPAGEPLDRLIELDALHRHLLRTFPPEAIPVWLRSPSHYLGGQAPVDMLQGGRFERVEAALEAIASGFFV